MTQRAVPLIKIKKCPSAMYFRMKNAMKNVFLFLYTSHTTTQSLCALHRRLYHLLHRHLHFARFAFCFLPLNWLHSYCQKHLFLNSADLATGTLSFSNRHTLISPTNAIMLVIVSSKITYLKHARTEVNKRGMH
jgi:hypothetical protein